MARASLTEPNYLVIELKRYLSAKHADEFYQQNIKRFESKSPYAVTDKDAGVRIVDNVILKGHGFLSTIKTKTQIVKRKPITDVSGGGGSWNLDSKVQFDKIYTCPVTKREFTQEDLSLYWANLRQEQKNYAAARVNFIECWNNPATRSIHVRYGEDKEHAIEIELNEHELAEIAGRP